MKKKKSDIGKIIDFCIDYYRLLQYNYYRQCGSPHSCFRRYRHMKKIIVTDDEPMNLKMTGFVLKKNGYDVIPAASGEECIQAVKDNDADLILLDLLMPEMNGFETFEKLRACEEGKNIPVILLSAAEDSDTLEKAASMGIFACVGKPFKHPDLLSKIELALN